MMKGISHLVFIFQVYCEFQVKKSEAARLDAMRLIPKYSSSLKFIELQFLYTLLNSCYYGGLFNWFIKYFNSSLEDLLFKRNQHVCI